MKYIKRCIVASLVVVMAASTTYALDAMQECVVLGDASEVVVYARLSGLSEEQMMDLADKDRYTLPLLYAMYSMIIPKVYRSNMDQVDIRTYPKAINKSVYSICISDVLRNR